MCFQKWEGKGNTHTQRGSRRQTLTCLLGIRRKLWPLALRGTAVPYRKATQGRPLGSVPGNTLRPSDRGRRLIQGRDKDILWLASAARGAWLPSLLQQMPVNWSTGQPWVWVPFRWAASQLLE